MLTVYRLQLFSKETSPRSFSGYISKASCLKKNILTKKSMMNQCFNKVEPHLRTFCRNAVNSNIFTRKPSWRMFLFSRSRVAGLQFDLKRAPPQTYLRDIFARHFLTKFQVYNKKKCISQKYVELTFNSKGGSYCAKYNLYIRMLMPKSMPMPMPTCQYRDFQMAFKGKVGSHT